MQTRVTRRGVLELFGIVALVGATFAGRDGAFIRPAAASTPTASPQAAPGDQVLFRIEYLGGFVPVEFLLTNLPSVSVYADGRVITTGPMIEIYPQPALPNLRQTVLTNAGLEQVLDHVRATGLFTASAHYDGPEVTDLPDTVFTLHDNGETVVVSAYALGFDEAMLPARIDAGARAKLIELQAFLFDLPARLAPEETQVADEAFPIERIKVFARAFDPANPPSDDPALAQVPVAWPLPAPLADGAVPLEGPYTDANMVCRTIVGDDAAALVVVLEEANRLTPFESDGKQYLLSVRPLLPDEPAACN